MSLQKRTLQRYRQIFPNDTLKAVSTRTGIQITRVFRLFNGKTMKVLELEALENAVHEKLRENPNHSRLTEVLEKASAVLTNDELAKIIDWIERKNTAKTYGRMYIRSTYENAYIA
ncbi:MAG TPA: hypothetical protein VNJ08_02540 [Bacteriovoracaceae bacterium]|nr:hypothetical protein [Bacteriovoracaceae bacterium]